MSKQTELLNLTDAITVDGSGNVVATGAFIGDGSALTGVSHTTTDVNTSGQDWAGIVYIDPDAVGANPTAKIYPDGSIVGSTDNGSYTKYPNGYLECRNSNLSTVYMAQNATTSGHWVYPCAFSAQPKIAIFAKGNLGVSYDYTYAVGADYVGYGEPLDNCRWSVLKTGPHTMPTRVSGSVTGRWK